ncbi:glutathione S-transferase T3-like [Brassica napus]|uniref:glutathione S-transferase T3-like n=1 Tax=Brassica napus TaxID=3708 RepID=UPI0020790D85|nr:glutathione S-transferase T3-like [Brassica napus]
MDSYPSTQSSKFAELLHSQQSISFGNYEDNVSLSSSQPLFQRTLGTKDSGETATESAFWTRVAAYFAANPPVVGCEQREPSHCKQRWHKINDLVCKFCGAYEAASREKSGGQNDNDILKLAHQIFYNNHKKKFTLEHTWKELWNDQKWCDLATAKNDGTSKKRKRDDGADSSSSQATENKRPVGVKAAKARGKKTLAEENALKDFESMWSIKHQDLAMKERLLKPDHQDERMNLKLHTDGRELVATESSSDASGTRLLPIGFASGCFLSGLQTADQECELADGERELAVMRTGS